MKADRAFELSSKALKGALVSILLLDAQQYLEIEVQCDVESKTHSNFSSQKTRKLKL